MPEFFISSEQVAGQKERPATVQTADLGIRRKIKTGKAGLSLGKGFLDEREGLRQGIHEIVRPDSGLQLIFGGGQALEEVKDTLSTRDAAGEKSFGQGLEPQKHRNTTNLPLT